MLKDTVINRIKAKRREKGLTQQELADKVGVSLMTVVRWEKGERTPNTSLLPEIAEALNVSVGYLMGSEDTPIPKEQVQGELYKLGEKVNNSDANLDETVSAGFAKNMYIIKDGNRVFYIPNDEDGQKMFLEFLRQSLAGVNNGTNSEYHDSVIHNGNALLAPELVRA